MVGRLAGHQVPLYMELEQLHRSATRSSFRSLTGGSGRYGKERLEERVVLRRPSFMICMSSSSLDGESKIVESQWQQR